MSSGQLFVSCKKTLRIRGIGGVDVADGHADDIGCKRVDDCKENILVIFGIQVEDPNLMTVCNRTGDIIEPERIHRIGLGQVLAETSRTFIVAGPRRP